MQKIAIVTDAWEPQVNGAVTTLKALIPRLEKRGMSVVVIQPQGFWTVRLPFYPEIRLALFPRRKVRKILREWEPDVVHIVTEGPLGLAARAVCVSEKRFFTTSFHTRFDHYVSLRVGSVVKRPAQAFLRWFHSGAAVTMVATEELRTALRQMRFKNLALWPLGVDTERFVRNLGAPVVLPRPTFVYVGRLAPEKNVEEFLEAELPGSKLVVGDGPMRQKLERRYGGNAKFVGYTFGQELVDLLSACDVFVFPSRTETLGLVVLEALACGLPVAAHDAMGPRDIITPGVDGYLSEDLADAASKALGLSREDCRKKALSYSWDASAEAFIRNILAVR